MGRLFSSTCLTVDPISSAILKIELADSRTAEQWQKHWEDLEENGYHAEYLVCDEGKGLCSAQKEALPDIIRQTDTYHAIAHVFGLLLLQLERSACSAIIYEDKCSKNLDVARSDKVKTKRTYKLKKAKESTIKAIDLYDNFQFLYSCLLEQLRIFDKNGQLCKREQAEENIKVALELIKTLEQSKLSNAVNKVYRTLPNLFHYFDVAKKIVGKLEKQGIDENVLCALCLVLRPRSYDIIFGSLSFYAANFLFCRV